MWLAVRMIYADLLSSGHHHASLDGVYGVGGQPGGDGDGPPQQEGVHHRRGVSQHCNTQAI